MNTNPRRRSIATEPYSKPSHADSARTGANRYSAAERERDEG